MILKTLIMTVQKSQYHIIEGNILTPYTLLLCVLLLLLLLHITVNIFNLTY